MPFKQRVKLTNILVIKILVCQHQTKKGRSRIREYTNIPDEKVTLLIPMLFVPVCTYLYLPSAVELATHKMFQTDWPCQPPTRTDNTNACLVKPGVYVLKLSQWSIRSYEYHLPLPLFVPHPFKKSVPYLSQPLLLSLNALTYCINI